MPAPLGKYVMVGVWESGEFAGCIVFTSGVSASLGSQYMADRLSVCELQRAALRPGHKATVSRVIAIALRFLRKHCPGIRLVVSFADPEQGHHGGIYQAGGWIYAGMSGGSVVYEDENGKRRHPRNVGIVAGWDSSGVRKHSSRGLRKVSTPGKHRYLMPLDDEIRARVAPLAKPYPKRSRVRSADSGTTPQE